MHVNVNVKAPPIPVVDVNGDKRAEIITIGCEHPDSFKSKFLVDRQITGIYAAKDARLVPMRKAAASPYLAVAKRQFSDEESIKQIHWRPTRPSRWPDFLAGYDRKPQAQIPSFDARYVVIDTPEGRDILLSDPIDLKKLPKKGYRFKYLGDSASQGLLWVAGGPDSHLDQIDHTPAAKREQ